MTARTLRADLRSVGYTKRPDQMSEEERREAHERILTYYNAQGVDFMANKHAAAEAGFAAALAAGEQTEHGRLTSGVKFFINQLQSMLGDGSTVDDYGEAVQHLHSSWAGIKKQIQGK